ncbi:MAG: hypothetical protein BAJATHORv1_30185 [Candidatus Thorarchaeota archaeon]|nr:MAG: hypothetical protein BAJATHORv1_30185 [Candidatus Thorarchaeota archaeon]
MNMLLFTDVIIFSFKILSMIYHELTSLVSFSDTLIYSRGFIILC